ncbi:MAG: ATP-binding protein [Fusobacteriaceae bacterium]
MSLAQITLKQAAKFIKAAIQAQLVPYLAGSPGCGKSALIHAIAKQANLKVLDFRLAQEDPTTINGFPSLENGRSKYLPPEAFPLQGDKLPVILDENGKVIHTYRGWLVFFDELPSAPKSVQAAAYKILLDRMIGQHHLHEACYLMAAGNLLTDGAIVYEMGSALRSRLIHIHTKSNPEEFIDEVAAKINLDRRIVAYLNYQKHKVNTFIEYNKGSSDETFACERTWDFASRLLKQIEPNQNKPVPDEYSVLLQGTVGSHALEFVQFTHAFNDLPDFKDIIADPLNAQLPTKPAVCWLLTSMITGNTTMENIDPVMDYVNRMPMEFQFAMAKQLWQKDDRLLDNPKLEATFTKVGSMLIG